MDELSETVTQPNNTKTSFAMFINIIQQYLVLIKDFLIEYFNKTLPKVTPDWWEKTIINKLSGDQLKTIKKNHNLDCLDLSELIKLFIANWDDISIIDNLTSDDKDVVYDTKKVRNRTSHLSKNKYKNFDDILRDFDIIQRFLNLINIGQNNIMKDIDDIEVKKLNIMQEKLKLSKPNHGENISSTPKPSPKEKPNSKHDLIPLSDKNKMKKWAMACIDKEKGLHLKGNNTMYSKVVEKEWGFTKKDVFFDNDAHIIMLNQDSKELHYFFIKGGIIRQQKVKFIKRIIKNIVHYVIYVPISENNFKENKTGFTFGDYKVATYDITKNIRIIENEVYINP